MQRVRMCAVGLLLVAVTAGVHAQTRFTTINADPLRIHVGSDGSFQIFNAAVPGVGQVYPTTSDLADMGVFANIDGQLYAPDFAAHGVTATGSLGSYTPWQPLATAPQLPSGSGAPGDPYVVSVALAAPGTDVRLTISVQYVTGQNFFRLVKAFSSPTPHTIDAYLAADIYLAGSDNGIFVSVPELNAVGGRSCEVGEAAYNILLIPITNASGFTAGHYDDVWRQIGENTLDNSGQDSGCIDNGAAVKWDNIVGEGQNSVALQSAVSFGEIPSASNFHGFGIHVEPSFVALSPGESATLTITTTHNPSLGFDAPIHLSAPDLPTGVSIEFDQDVVPAPGSGTVTAVVRVDGNAFPQLYQSIAISGSGGEETRWASFALDVICTPPKILGKNQLGRVTVKRGDRATLNIQPIQEGLYTYQWFRGHAPLTGFPVRNSNSAQLVTEPINQVTQYWVRISNNCGSVNSLTATIVPTD